MLLCHRIFVVLAVALMVAGRAFAFDVTQCGDVIPRGETGVLTTDLDCSGMLTGRCDRGPNAGLTCASHAECIGGNGAQCAVRAVTIEPGANLNLAGHSIAGTPASPTWWFEGLGPTPVWAIWGAPSSAKDGKIRITGPGSVRGHLHFGWTGSILGPRRAGWAYLSQMDVFDGGVDTSQNLVLSDVTLSRTGVHSTGTMTLTNVTSSNAPHYAFGGAVPRLTASNVTITDCGSWGIMAWNLKGTGITVTGCGWNPGTIPLVNLPLTGGGIGFHGGRLSNSRVEGNFGNGIEHGRMLKLENVEVLNNSGHGVHGYSSGITNFLGGTVLGNAVDIFSLRRPRGTVTCGTSNWGFCAND